MNMPAIMLAALTIEALLGWPDALDRRIGHPVRWFGWLVAKLEAVANRPALSRWAAIATGGGIASLLIVCAAAVGFAFTRAVPAGAIGGAILALIAASLIAARSLHEHVAAVRSAYVSGGIDEARTALGRIVGRDTRNLDEAGIARAAIESLAENTSDSVTAPLFWGALFGLPGLFAYKAINTLDSMIGHRNPRYEAFGKIAARLDDIANIIPARLTGLLFGICGGSGHALAVMLRDASQHRSPNAGWPESAMAGALSIRLSGPRDYGETTAEEPWLNAYGRDAAIADIDRALALYRRAIAAVALLLGGFAWAIW